MKEPGPSHPIVVTLHRGRVRVMAGGQAVAETDRALLLREADYPPVLYVPRVDVRMALFRKNPQVTTCPYKGEASYFDVNVGDAIRESVAWSYENPFPAVSRIREHFAFYPSRVDAIEAEP